MDAVNFSILAPRFGSHPMMSSYSGIGNSGMNGGAFNWGGLWSGIKSFGSNVKSWGSRAWNSETGKLLRQKLNDTKVREKLVEGINTGVHGALDIANQEIARQIEKRLERREPLQPPEEEEVEEEIVRTKEAPLVVDLEKKRPRDEELLITADEPPSYEEAVMSAAPVALRRDVVVEKPAMAVAPPVYSPPARPVSMPVAVAAPAPAPVAAPPMMMVPSSGSSRSRGWQGTLANIVGVGLRGVKRRRCF
ncbi:pVI [Bat adenovirus 2]|uniref:Pre-protein VI n=1 Tax=Bat adenovirus 2 TaxID=696069 RepID=G1FQM7_9ADEN|nr:pVI [Bat adenovirus 2]AEM06274.1 pVI [Bat adenovirus 2]